MKFIFSILLFFSLQSQAQIIRANPNYRPFVSAASCSYLLDQYSGAAAAYSLRKLDCDYTGYAIRVRESGGNTEMDIGFTANGDLDTATLKTFVGANNGFVVTWYDQSGNSRNAIQTTSANQPKIVNSGTILRTNGKPTVSFGTNTDEWYLTLPTGFLYLEDSLSFISVLNVTDFASSNAAVFGPYASFSVGLELLQLGSAGVQSVIRLDNVIRNNNSGAGYRFWNNSTQTLSEIYGNTTSISAYNNSASVSLTNTSAVSLGFNGVYSIGAYFSATYNMYGDIQEIIIYSSDKITNRSGIESNINTYYSIY